MSDRIFADTNVLVYSIADDQQKRTTAELILLDNDIVVSPQVINEFISVTLRKRILPPEQVVRYAAKFMQVFEVTAMTKQTITAALDVMNRYQLSYWDSLIVAAALESDCPYLYTEDLQHGQKIEKQLMIFNPFIPVSDRPDGI
ncbi:MAG: PIN domain-containing protein [Candidatus Electrothrix aestuarii]|uniref:PIN domain-containing protein n=1 Tax=Candidatus Electrothrix aestuarii TaxID=3062594 RepID=A0AAU8LXE5_9BACT|nr:PIN domain-containing protein [Candidatus Electrothrix aestuarii]